MEAVGMSSIPLLRQAFKNSTPCPRGERPLFFPVRFPLETNKANEPARLGILPPCNVTEHKLPLPLACNFYTLAVCLHAHEWLTCFTRPDFFCQHHKTLCSPSASRLFGSPAKSHQHNFMRPRMRQAWAC
eukprot:scaffold176174_cov17-Tisochrysis_lutea.AAC.2